MRINITPGPAPGQPNHLTATTSATPTMQQETAFAWILVESIAADGDISRPIRCLGDAQLRELVLDLQLHEILLPNRLTSLGLPVSEGPGFWAEEILPLIHAELVKRTSEVKTG